MGSVIRRDVKELWSMHTRLPSNQFSPSAYAGEASIWERAGSVTEITPAGPVQTVSGPLVCGEAVEWRFNYVFVTLDQYYVFSTAAFFGGACDFPCVLDILEDSDEGIVIVDSQAPQKIATSRAPREGSLLSPALPNDPTGGLGTTILFRPSDYRKPDGSLYITGYYRVRLRGIPAPHPWFRFQVGQGGDFTMAYRYYGKDFRANIDFYPRAPVVGQEVTFRADGYGANHPGATVDWTFGDTGTGSGYETTHTYASPGTYEVTLTTGSGVTDLVQTKAVIVVLPALHPERPLGPRTNRIHTDALEP